MAQTNQAYTYTSLQHSDSIRLLELLPGVKGSPLSCNLTEVRRGNRPQYEALSYAWGEPVFSQTVQEVASCKRLSITFNLHTALQAIRHGHASRVLWVDAICINQLNVEEKNHQVASMEKIFGDAWRVVVWLGRHRAAPNRLMCILQDLINLFRVWEGDREAGQTRLENMIARLLNTHIFQQQWCVSYLFSFFDIHLWRMGRTFEASRRDHR
jgi:hypothetical protein